MSSESHMGLLQKANLLSQKKGLAFCEFILKHQIKFCAIFESFKDTYSISQSIGFDSVSLLSSSSTDDFWKGIAPEKNHIYKFSSDQKNLNNLLQFFSMQQKDLIDFITIYRNSNKIFFLCNQEISFQIINDFNLIDSNLIYNPIQNYETLTSSSSILCKYEIDIEEAIRCCISDNKSVYPPSIAEKILVNEITNRLFFNFLNPHFIYKSAAFNIKIVLNSQEDIPLILFSKHLINSLREVLGNNSAFIEIKDAGKCKTCSQIQSFFKE